MYASMKFMRYNIRALTRCMGGLILAVVMVSGASADASYLECTKIVGSARSSLVPDQIIIAREVKSGKVTVADSGGFRTGQLPAKGKVKQDNASKLMISWKRKLLREVPGKSQPPIFFNLVLDKKSGTARVSRRSLTYSRVEIGKVRCAPMAAAQVAQIEKLLRSPKVQREVKKGRANVGQFTCTLAVPKTGLAFLPRRFEFELPKVGREAMVSDVFSLKHTGKKILALMDQEYWPEVRLSWSLTGISRKDMAGASGGVRTGKVLMQASVNRNSGKFSLRVRTDTSAAPQTYKGICKKAG